MLRKRFVTIAVATAIVVGGAVSTAVVASEEGDPIPLPTNPDGTIDDDAFMRMRFEIIDEAGQVIGWTSGEDLLAPPPVVSPAEMLVYSKAHRSPLWIPDPEVSLEDVESVPLPGCEPCT